MGPTQSSIAAGCVEEKGDHKKEGRSTKQAKDTTTTSPPTQPKIPSLKDGQFTPPSDNSDNEQESHKVRVNPVHEYALCRKIRDTFKTEEPTGEEKSQISENAQSCPNLAEKDGVNNTIVSVQPQSLVSSDKNGIAKESENELVDDGFGSPSGISAFQQCMVSAVSNCPIQNFYPTKKEGVFAESDKPLNTKHTNQKVESSAQTREITTCEQDTQTTKSDMLITTTQETNNSNPAQIQPEDANTSDTKSMTEINTDCKSTQTTQPHPNDISLGPAPPRPIMINVSTPPDETSPMFCKLSDLDKLLGGDTPVSSPDCDGSDAGYITSKFGSASQDGSAAAGACESPAELVRRKASGRSRKKEEKNIEYILRSLGHLSSPQDKLTVVCKKYTDLHEEQKAFHAVLKQHQRKMTLIQRERDHLQTEHTKGVVAKSKLESLCRELQKQNKVVKEESLQRLKDEEEKRKQMSSKFQKSIADIQAQVNENHEQNIQLRTENQQLSSRLKDFLHQHQAREEQLDQLSHHRHLEKQLAEVRLEQAGVVLKEEKAQHLKEKEMILQEATESAKKNALLEEQLKKYMERYEDFQDTISKSSDAFHKLKTDMEKMGKRIKKLEKEGERWKSKWETTNKELLNMTEEKSQCDKEKDKLQTKVTKLESLCRALQVQLHQTCASQVQLHQTTQLSGQSSSSGESSNNNNSNDNNNDNDNSVATTAPCNDNTQTSSAVSPGSEV